MTTSNHHIAKKRPIHRSSRVGPSAPDNDNDDGVVNEDSWTRGELALRLKNQKLANHSPQKDLDNDEEMNVDDDVAVSSSKPHTPSLSKSRGSAHRNSSSDSQNLHNEDGHNGEPLASARTNGEKRNRDPNSEGSEESDLDYRLSRASKRPSQSGLIPSVRSGSTPRSSGSSRLTNVNQNAQNAEDSDADAALRMTRLGSSASKPKSKRESSSGGDRRAKDDIDLYRKTLEEKMDDESSDSVTDMRDISGGRSRILGLDEMHAPLVRASTDFQATFSRSKTFHSAMSDGGGSDRSYMSGSVLALLTTQETRSRSFLVGSMCAGGPLLGAEELEKYFPERKMRVYIGTYNMCEMKSVPGSLNDFILPENSEYVQDAYVIGTQESVTNRFEWELKIQETLGPQYVLFHSGSHGTLHLVVFLRRDLVWYTSVSEEAIVTTRPGPSGIRTKGSVGVCFHIFGSSFLFINSHFTAHEGKSVERIEDYKKTIAGLALPKINDNKFQTVPADDVTAKFDCVFWMGDLNCRLERDRPYLESLIYGLESADKHSKIGIVDYGPLVALDELTRVMGQGLSFRQFHEGRIKFRPTFKYDIDENADVFDTSIKNRSPSYTDRILFRTRTKNSIACLCYDSVPSMRDSDHKPVYGLYEVLLRPGIDSIVLSGGQFNREVWLEGNRRRALKTEVCKTLISKNSLPTRNNSSICSVM